MDLLRSLDERGLIPKDADICTRCQRPFMEHVMTLEVPRACPPPASGPFSFAGVEARKLPSIYAAGVRYQPKSEEAWISNPLPRSRDLGDCVQLWCPTCGFGVISLDDCPVCKSRVP